MPWFKVDDNLGFHHKVIAAGNPAIGLWVRAGAVCAQQLTDGFVPDHMVAALGTTAQAKRLVDVGLWDRVEGGYTFHEWSERQPSKADVEAERAAAKERMRAARERKRKAAQEAEAQVSDPRSGNVRPNKKRTSAEVPALFADPDPSRPDPTRPPEKPGNAVALHADTEVDARVLVAEWIDNCAEKPPGRVIGHVARELKTMLEEGIDPARVRNGLIEWNRRGLHPSTLASVVHEVSEPRRRPGNRQAETDDLFDRAMQRAAARENAG